MEYCSQIYYGKLKNINYPINLSKKLSGRLSGVHKEAKEKSIRLQLDNKNLMKNEELFNGKTTKFISNEITNLE